MTILGEKKKSKKDKQAAELRETQNEMNDLRVAIQEGDRWKAFKAGTLGKMVSDLMSKIDRDAWEKAKSDRRDAEVRKALGTGLFKDIFERTIDAIINKGDKALLDYDLLEKKLTGRE